MTDPRETLNRIKEQADAATRGPWTPQDYDHNPGDQGVPIIGGGELGSMEGHLTAYAMTLFNEEQSVADGAFIAASRTTVPRLVGALQAVLNLHQEDLFRGHLSNGCKTCEGGEWPCATYRAITDQLGDDR